MPITAPDQLLEAIADSDRVTGNKDKADEWESAIRAAIRESSLVLIATGVLSEDDAFYQAVSRVANDGFQYEALAGAASKSIEGHPDCFEIDERFNAAEYAKWRGAYALGLVVGMRLAGGAR
jgi:hypothetical protein